jgi:hypothetical protein
MYYVKVRAVDGNHNLFQSGNRDECVKFMLEWTGYDMIPEGKNELITDFGDIVYIDNNSLIHDEVFNIRECYEYNEAIEHFCKDKCNECRFYENICLIKKAFNK